MGRQHKQSGLGQFLCGSFNIVYVHHILQQFQQQFTLCSQTAGRHGCARCFICIRTASALYAQVRIAIDRWHVDGISAVACRVDGSSNDRAARICYDNPGTIHARCIYRTADRRC